MNDFIFLLFLVGSTAYFFFLVGRILNPPKFDVSESRRHSFNKMLPDMQKLRMDWDAMTASELVDERCFYLRRYQTSTSSVESRFWLDVIGEVDLIIQKKQRQSK